MDRIKEAIEWGERIFGENYVQEARQKIEAIGRDDIEWHLIGHLQTNKARYAVRYFNLIHSVDSESLANELDRRAGMAGNIMKVLIQVNLAGEAGKSGVRAHGVRDLTRKIASLTNLSLEGLMILPPYIVDKEAVRPYFRRLREMRDSLEDEMGIRLKELSMGMSHDFEVAIEEGATMVRIGSAIFGERL